MSDDVERTSTAERLSRRGKKCQRKLNRFLAGLARRKKVDVADSPTAVIMVTNAGLTTENQPEELLELFLQSGSADLSMIIDKIVMPIGESYSFVQLPHVQGSVAAMEAIHGKKSLPSSRDGRPLYLVYVHAIPDDAADSRFDNRIPPDGLIIMNDVVTEAEETTLLNSVQWDNNDENEQLLKHRRVKHYGYEFCYGSNDVDRDNPLTGSSIPQPCLSFLRKMHDAKLISAMPDQLTVNQYQPGQGIPSHVDTHSAFQDEILSLSLGSDVVMDFKLDEIGRTSNVFLARRSLAVMTGASRYLWSHGITPRKTDVVIRDESSKGRRGLTLSHRDVRTSFTFRTVRWEQPCRCQYDAEQCDSKRTSSSSAGQSTFKQPVSNEDVQLLEDLHVYQVYDRIADHFSDTRHKAWSCVEDFIRSFPPGTLILDVGCGNGKYLSINASTYKVGCDRSENLMAICSQRGFQGFCCDALRLPIRSNSFDACLCIAVIHHLATRERRGNAIAELARVLKPDGKALIYVWAMEQNDPGGTESSYIRGSKQQQQQQQQHQKPKGSAVCASSTFDAQLPVHVNRTPFASQDVLVPWHLKTKTRDGCDGDAGANHVYHRYYHVFEKGELESLCAANPSVRVIRTYYDEGNWCAVVQKLSSVE